MCLDWSGGPQTRRLYPWQFAQRLTQGPLTYDLKRNGLKVISRPPEGCQALFSTNNLQPAKVRCPPRRVAGIRYVEKNLHENILTARACAQQDLELPRSSDIELLYDERHSRASR